MSLFARILAFLGVLLFCGVAQAQGPGGAPIAYLYCYTGSGPITSPTNWTACSASTPVPISGSFSATVSGFAPASTGTPISVTTGGVTGTLPAGTVVVASNVGSTNGAYCKLGASATTSDQLIPPNSWFAFTVGASTQLTCITSTSTTTVNMVGGSGLPTGAGGGGGGSGGTVTQGNAGTNAQAWWMRIGDATSGPAKVQAGNAAATTDVAVTVADPNVLAAVRAPVPAGTNIIGKVGIDQTTPGTTNGVQVNAAIPAGTNTVGNTGSDPSSGKATPTIAFLAFPATTTTQIIALSGTKVTYVTLAKVFAGGTVNLTFKYGTGSNCGTGTTTLEGPYALTAQSGWVEGNGSGPVMIVPAGQALCVTTDATVSNSGVKLVYQQF